jgi:hypothetical protein
MLDKPHRQNHHQTTIPSEHDMKTTCQSLPGILSVAYLPVDRVQRHCDLKCLSSIPVQVFTTPTQVPLKGPATCETVSRYDNNGRVETTTLRFRSLEPVPTTHPLAFIVTDANRQSYLVGLHEPPYPIVRSTRTTGTPSGDPAVISHEVTFTALKALIPLG